MTDFTPEEIERVCREARFHWPDGRRRKPPRLVSLVDAYDYLTAAIRAGVVRRVEPEAPAG